MTPAEHHLGDRLAALVDGELGHDARERVLSHLATCRSCKAEADAQRRLKNVFADAAPPPPSDGLLARLQGLPAGGDGKRPEDDRHDGPGGSPDARLTRAAGERDGVPSLPSDAGSPWAFDYLPAGRTGVSSALRPGRGFRIHEVHRVDRSERSASRGRRFAFAAAGAFSLAALAIGGAFTSTSSGGTPTASGDGSGSSASPVRSAASGSGAASRDSRRRALSGEQRERGDYVLSASAARSRAASTFAAGAAGLTPGGTRNGALSVLSTGADARSGGRSPAPPVSAAERLFPASGQGTPLGTSTRSPATGAAGWYPQFGSPGPLNSLSSLGGLTAVSARAAADPEGFAPVTYDATSLRAYPGRVPLATAPSATPTAAVPPKG